MSPTATRLDRYPSRSAPHAEILPRLDPVCWAGQDAPGPLAGDALASFDRDGYLLLPDLLPPAEVAHHLAEIRRMTADPELLARPQTITEPGSDRVRSVFEVHRSSPVFAALAADPRIAGAARQILGSAVYIHQSRLNVKPGFHGKEFSWHSDFETWHTEDGMPAVRAVSAAIALTDNTEHNGPLMVIPGSHRSFVTCVGQTPAENYRSSLRAQVIGTPDPGLLTELADRHGIVAPKGAAGSVVLFDANMMHGSNSNITPYARSNAFFVYNSVENALEEPFAAPGVRPEYIAHREHTEPVGPR